ncbi:DUF6798 domain-containing protein [Mastigocoleus testarum]|uniref:DUF6798 domain-containing protein n=1 Tax=Mastigocoleus testarum BC008 TaxID=371196 RepID=A0A0V7ZJZ5_9CYAN|nr:DUF6798 domain-containing protein [Mastigocoleus testarum]KST64059.1 hypothetical protein BC008_40410 [Mastigocoleus testarum BC008]KST64769.1 hypothetical protein BC008_41385 [Mastigocoleus testarum BC008]
MASLNSSRLIKNKQRNILIITSLAVFTLIVISELLKGNMTNNEIGKLLLARQYVDPGWIPEDFYINQPQKYQIIFQSIFGKLSMATGFLATSIIGRMTYYLLFALGVTLLSAEIGLNFYSLLLATILFLNKQGMIAGEWIIGELGPKGFSYAFISIALWLVIKKYYIPMAIILGLATSFHVLVGGYATISIALFLVLQILSRQIECPSLRKIGAIFIVYIVFGCFSIIPIFQHFTSSSVDSIDSRFTASYIYVFLRNPHHLYPLAWSIKMWLWLVFYISLATLICFLIHKNKFPFNSSDLSSQQKSACSQLSRFALVMLIPFVLGLVIFPIDRDGKFLQYYPFRFGDAMLPMITCLLFCRALECSFPHIRVRKIFLSFCAVIVAMTYVHGGFIFIGQAFALQGFPWNHPDGIRSNGKAMFAWIKDNTPKNSVIISPPAKFNEFTWLSERATIAKFKHVPSDDATIQVWYERLNDLSGNPNKWEKVGFAVREQLNDGYANLTTRQVESLMLKYKAKYFMTASDHQLDLPIAYQDQEYIIYSSD